MKITVRLDDITPDMDWERFLKFKALLDRYQVKPLIGVVPDNRDENLVKKELSAEEKKLSEGFWEYIKALKEDGWVIAMHGFRHIYSTKKGGCFPLNNFSEFAGLPFARQQEMLTEGKEILHEKGIPMIKIHGKPFGRQDSGRLRTDLEKSPTGMPGLIFIPFPFGSGAPLKRRADIPPW